MGEAAALGSAALWAAATLVFTFAGARIPAIGLNLLKTALATGGLLLTSWLLTGRFFPSDLDPSALAWLGLSGVIGLTIGDSLYFASLYLLGPRRALMLWALTPAVTAVLAQIVLGEAMTPSFVGGLGLTSVGVALVLFERAPAGVGSKPDLEARQIVLGTLAGLGAVLCQAGGTVTAKLGGDSLSGLELSSIRMVFGTVALVLPGLWALRRSPFRLNPSQLFQISAATFLGSYLGIWLSMAALQNAYAGVVATLQSTSPIFVLPMARIVLQEPVSVRAALGAMLAVAGVAWLSGWAPSV